MQRLYTIPDREQIKQKVLNWARPFSTFCFLDDHEYGGKTHSLDWMMAAGIRRSITASAGHALEQLQAFIGEQKSWLFGHLGYDLKNELAGLRTTQSSGIAFPDLFFFEPAVRVHVVDGELSIDADDPDSVYKAILAAPLYELADALVGPVRSRFTKETYCNMIETLRGHIRRGDCYEVNFCQEFFAENTTIDPVDVYHRLSAVSPNPFSALYRNDDQWLICASPERFLKKQGDHIFSQPIKGTLHRSKGDETRDALMKKELWESAKDRSENVMVVDLVRNDLSRICTEGSVQVDELFGIYTFPQVHQMISTISGKLQPGTSLYSILQACFPMGSMTGAPKQRVMELIGKYEMTKRGIFSGALGYIDPDGDFDFNVVIRSILYNADTKYLSFPAGSGITFYSEPEKEWEECLWKAAAIRQVLGGT